MGDKDSGITLLETKLNTPKGYLILGTGGVNSTMNGNKKKSPVKKQAPKKRKSNQITPKNATEIKTNLGPGGTINFSITTSTTTPAKKTPAKKTASKSKKVALKPGSSFNIPGLTINVIRVASPAKKTASKNATKKRKVV